MEKTKDTLKIFDFRKRDIIWTASDFNADFANANFPYIELIEYEQTHGAILAQFNQWLRLGQQIVEKLTNVINKVDPYDLLYIAKPTNNQYYLPYFMQYHHSINNHWEASGLAEIGGVKAVLDIGQTVAQLWSPAVGLTVPRSFKGTDDASYGIEFTLFNTVDLESADGKLPVGMMRNKEFIETIIQQNLFDFKDSGIVIRPPSLYEVMIPGIRYCPVAIISSLTVNNVGSMNRYGNYIYPDAWSVTINIQELIKESGQIYKDATSGNLDAGMSVRILNRGEEFAERAEAAKPIVTQTAANIINPVAKVVTGGSVPELIKTGGSRDYVTKE